MCLLGLIKNSHSMRAFLRSYNSQTKNDMNTKLALIDFFPEGKRQLRSSWLQTSGNQIIIMLVMGIANVRGMIDNTIARVSYETNENLRHVCHKQCITSSVCFLFIFLRINCMLTRKGSCPLYLLHISPSDPLQMKYQQQHQP